MRQLPLIAVLSTVAAVALPACGDAAGEPRPPLVRTADPVTAFAPEVRLHHGERRFPLAASRFLDHSTLEWVGGVCPFEINVAAGPAAQRVTREGAPPLVRRRLGHAPAHTVRPRRDDCRGRKRATVAANRHARPWDGGRDLPGVQPGEGFALDFVRAGYPGTRRLARVPVYFERSPTAVDGGPGLRLTYWMLFGTHEVLGPDGMRLSAHEGDWERFEVVIARGSARGSYRPSFVRRFVDGRPRTAAWSDLRWTRADGDAAAHPVLFAARASHTLYPAPGRHPRMARSGYSGEPGRVLEVAACGGRCPIWRTWRVLRPVRAQPWYGYGGGWGVRGQNDPASGPLGPSPYGRRAATAPPPGR